jgi:yeast amino acid transporter
MLTPLPRIPFEMTALQRLIGFWDSDGKMPVEATTFVVIFLYGLLNCVSVKWFGIAEFYLSLGKVFLIFLTFAFTFVTMLGGNPLHDRYGFRYWDTPVRG